MQEPAPGSGGNPGNPEARGFAGQLYVGFIGSYCKKAGDAHFTCPFRLPESLVRQVRAFHEKRPATAPAALRKL